MQVVGLYRGRPYTARLSREIWVAQSDGAVFVFPALKGEAPEDYRIQVERLFDVLAKESCSRKS